MQKLFEEFSNFTAQQWKELLVKDLKGDDPSKLDWKTKNNFTLHPFYTQEDLTEKKQALFAHHDWDICTYILAENAKSANEEALKELNSGATSLLFFLYPGINLNELLKD
ncbi:MAG TPA: hypothetical protein VNX68_17750, partial [Nitrosopumilaceae archaeon]|nr:hypothetical protein [Nitrosopumilaceae archaeon]